MKVYNVTQALKQSINIKTIGITTYSNLGTRNRIHCKSIYTCDRNLSSKTMSC